MLCYAMSDYTRVSAYLKFIFTFLNMDNFGLPDKTIEMIKNLFHSYSEINEVKIFGSRAKGNYKPGSDIDLAIFGEIDEKFLT